MRGLAAALLAVAVFGGTRGVSAAEEILHFASHIAVAASGDITVTESITVNAEGKQIRRGIRRDLSTQYQDVDGNPIEIPMTVVSAERDGETVPYHVEKHEGEVRVYVGAADVLMGPGEYTFGLVYRTRGQIRPIQGLDTLSWNTTGGWPFPIRKAECTIGLPAPVAEESLQTAAYTGTHDARRKDYTVEFPAPGVVRFESTRPLAAGEGLVVAVVFPAGNVQSSTHSPAVPNPDQEPSQLQE